MKTQPIRFDRLDSIYRLHSLITDVISGFRHRQIDSIPYNVSRAFGEHWCGRCFRMKKKTGTDVIWPIFGIHYKSEPPVICLSFDKNWSGPIYKAYNGKKLKSAPFTVTGGDGEVRFELGREKFTEFASSLSLTRQRAILAEFLKTVTNHIAPYF